VGLLAAFARMETSEGVRMHHALNMGRRANEKPPPVAGRGFW
jgi:hypothetical protein